MSRVLPNDGRGLSSLPPSSANSGNGLGASGSKLEPEEDGGVSGEGGGPEKDGIAFIFALDNPGKYLSSKSAHSEMMVFLVVGL